MKTVQTKTSKKAEAEGASQCFKSKKDKNPIANCRCHSSCGSCGYNNNPVRDIDCITCAKDDVNVDSIFGDGTGRCLEKATKETGSSGRCFQNKNDLRQGKAIKNCSCHSSCNNCGFFGRPNREIDCIDCSQKGTSVEAVFGDGTGICRSKNAADSYSTDLSGSVAVPNQRWKIVYLDQAEKIAKTGYNEDFGFHVNRPFYIRSRLPMKRIAECQGASNVFLKRWRKNVAAQTWFFDPVAKVIRSNHWKNYIMHIPGNGGQNSLRMTSSITSRWW